MPSAVITGCNSGIGHEFAKVLIDEVRGPLGYHVFAVDVNDGEKLRSLQGPNCKTFQMDVTSPESIAEFKHAFGTQPVDVLLNIAGIMPTKERDNLQDLTLPVMEKAFAINAFGPVLLTQALLPNILASTSSKRHVAVMSSRVGSMADNTSGGYLAYRASKAAANSFFKTIAVDLKEQGVIVSILHPGFTKTNLDQDIWKMPGAEEPAVPAQKLWALLKEKTIDQTGMFWHRDGMELPW